MQLKKFLYRNFGAQITSQLVILLVQLGSIPVLLENWGAEKFGIWLMISTVPVYLSLADMGFTFVAKNNMAMAVAGGNQKKAVEIYQSVYVVLICMGLMLFCFYLLCCMFLGEIKPFLDKELLIAIGCLGVSAIIYQFMLLLFGAIRAIGRSDLETYFLSFFRVVEFVFLVLSVLSGGGVLCASIVILLSKLFCAGLLYFWVLNNVSWGRLGIKNSSWSVAKKMLAPSAKYMLIPVSNSFLIQGPLLFLGYCNSPSVVASFSVMRTVARLGVSAGNVLNYAFVPAYGYSYGARDYSGFLKRVRIHVFFTLVLVVIYGIGTFFLGEWGYLLLSKDSLDFDQNVFLIIGASVVFEILWNCFSSPGVAINKSGGVPWVLFCVSLGLLVMASLICFTSFWLAVYILFAGGVCLLFSIFNLLGLVRGGGEK